MGGSVFMPRRRLLIFSPTVCNLPPMLMKSWRVEATIWTMFGQLPMVARDYKASQHWEFLYRPRCRFVSVHKHAPQLHRPTFGHRLITTPSSSSRQMFPQSSRLTHPYSNLFLPPSPRLLLDAWGRRISSWDVLGNVDRYKTVDFEKGVVVGVCGLWSAADPSQSREKLGMSIIQYMRRWKDSLRSI